MRTAAWIIGGLFVGYVVLRVTLAIVAARILKKWRATIATGDRVKFRNMRGGWTVGEVTKEPVGEWVSLHTTGENGQGWSVHERSELFPAMPGERTS